MPDRPQSTPAPNLNSDTEHVRREVYDLVVRMQFSPLPAESVGPDDYTGPNYDPDEAGLKVFYIFGRWFAVWSVMDHPGHFEHQTTALVRVAADPSSPFGIALHEV